MIAPDIAASCGKVTSFPGRRYGSGDNPACQLFLAGDGDVVGATGAAAGGVVCTGQCTADFMGIDPPERSCLGEIARLAERTGGRDAAAFAVGEALIDAVPVGLIGDNKNVTFRDRRRHADRAQRQE